MKYIGTYSDPQDIATKANVDAVEDKIPANTSDLTNDSGFITSAQAPVQSVNSKTGAVTLSASDVGAVPTTRTVNGKALSANINLTADDVGALPDSTVIPTIPDNLVQYTAIGAVQDVDALNADTLEGHNAAYFATSAGLTTTNNKVTTNANNITTLTTGLSTANGNISSLQTGKVDKSGDTMTGALVAQSNTNYTTAQMRNIIISTADPSGGASGDIWIKYQA